MPTLVNERLDVGVVRCALDETRTGLAWLISMWVAPEVLAKA